MQNWAKERREQKQNKQMLSFQIKTRQYTNLATLGPSANNAEDSTYSPKQTPKIQNITQNSFNFPNFMNKAQKVNFKQRYHLEEDQPNFSALSTYNQKIYQQRNDIGKISRNNNLQLDYRKYLKQNNTPSKSSIKKEYIDKSYIQNINMMETSQNLSFKRENAKKKGIEMKMTNIDSINDQISSLLNMVNKNKRINDNSDSKPKNRYDYKDAHDFKEKQISLQKYRHKVNVTPSPSKNPPIQNNKRFINKQHRQRIYSDLDHQFREGFESIKYENKKQKYIACNQEDNRLSEQFRNNKSYKYSPKHQYDNQKYQQNKTFERSTSPYQRQHAKSAYSKKQTYPERQFQKTISPYRQYNKKPEQTHYNNTTPKRITQNTQFSGHKYFNKERPDQLIEQKLPEYVPKYKKIKQKMEKSQNQMLPLSIQAVKYTEKTSKNQRSSFAYEENLQAIRGKIVESQQKTLKYQQRLRQQETGLNNEYKPTGRLYKKNEPQFQNKFELKIYPVQVDRPNTLKIAQKLADQIQIDKKLTIPRILLEQEEDQYKWSQIELSLKTKQFKMTKLQIQHLLELSPQQKDSNLHKGYENHKNIGNLLSQAQRHWQNQVYGCASQKGLKLQNFTAETIDSCRNGFVSAEDLAHFIDTYTGRKYRSKDAILIYRRLQLLQGCKNNETVQFSTFVRAFAI